MRYFILAAFAFFGVLATSCQQPQGRNQHNQHQESPCDHDDDHYD